MTTPPVWLNDTPEILWLCNWFINRLNKRPASARTKPVVITLNEKNIPGLFIQGEAADHLWDLIKSLEEDHQVFHIRQKNQKDPFSPEYTRARLTLKDGGEDILRSWLQRAKGLSPLQAWRKAVAENQHRFPGKTEKLSAHHITLHSMENSTIIDAFVSLAEYQRLGLSLRQLSSRCFFGDSKFLDNREELIRELYPDLHITPRPVMVNIFIPATVHGILFIENQDSYTRAMAGSPAICKNWILVYAAGFKGSATRIRQPNGVSLHYHGKSNNVIQKQLEAWWFAQQVSEWPVCFWGDMDYSGMDILKALKQRFDEMHAWQPGYEVMLKLLQQQKGHRPVMADKQEQQDPGTTGCDFADKILLPAIRQEKQFVDQEIVF
ncbi:MAG: DUF2220 family protein [Gammaproteobacteria bacterium]|nr:DUF2220 family protein [Gammaproteobacteria bacterium]